MSDAKPFAEAMSDGDEWYVVIDGIKLGSSCANAICHRAARINAAVDRERREAAAEALGKLRTLIANAEDDGLDGDELSIHIIENLDRMLSEIEAAALRKGDG